MLSRSPAPAVAEQDDWDGHWESSATASERNPAVAYRARLLPGCSATVAARRGCSTSASAVGDFLELAARTLAGRPGSRASTSARPACGSPRERVPGARCSRCDLTADARRPPVELDGWATHAVCSEVLEHVDEPVALLRNASRLMAPGCRLVVTVPSGPMSAFDRHIGHRRHYTGELLSCAARPRADSRSSEVMRAGFPFFNLYRAAVRARGESAGRRTSGGRSTPRRRLRCAPAMAVFAVLFRLNLTRSPWGGQLAATARPRG